MDVTVVDWVDVTVVDGVHVTGVEVVVSPGKYPGKSRSKKL